VLLRVVELIEVAESGCGSRALDTHLYVMVNIATRGTRGDNHLQLYVYPHFLQDRGFLFSVDCPFDESMMKKWNGRIFSL
jgi:hypothetical protein